MIDVAAKVKPERNSFDVVGEALSRTTRPEIDTVKLPKKTDAEHNGIFNSTIHKLSRRSDGSIRQCAPKCNRSKVLHSIVHSSHVLDKFEDQQVLSYY